MLLTIMDCCFILNEHGGIFYERYANSVNDCDVYGNYDGHEGYAFKFPLLLVCNSYCIRKATHV